MEQESGNLLLSGPDAQTEPLAVLLISRCLVRTKKEGWDAKATIPSLSRGRWAHGSLSPGYSE